MKRTLQILIFAIITVSVPTDSYSFISALTKGGKLLFKGKIWKAGGATGASSIDNVAKKALDIKKIDKNLIDEIGKAEHEKIFKSIKETPDEKVLSEYKHYDDTSIKDPEFSWLVPRPAYRHLGKEVKSENSVYVCEKNTGEIFYFSIMPKRNKALVSSTDKTLSFQMISPESVTISISNIPIQKDEVNPSDITIGSVLRGENDGYSQIISPELNHFHLGSTEELYFEGSKSIGK